MNHLNKASIILNSNNSALHQWANKTSNYNKIWIQVNKDDGDYFL